MVEYYDLDDEELLDVVHRRRTTDRVCEVLDEWHGSDNLIDESLACYWGRRLAKKEFLDDSDLEYLLSLGLHETTRKLVGEAAQKNQLTADQVDRALAEMQVDEWPYRQLEARRDLMILYRDILEAGGPYFSDETAKRRLELIQSFLRPQIGWAAIDCIPYLTDEELSLVERQWVEGCGLSRRHRNYIREKIQRIREERASS